MTIPRTDEELEQAIQSFGYHRAMEAIAVAALTSDPDAFAIEDIANIIDSACCYSSRHVQRIRARFGLPPRKGGARSASYYA